MAISKDATPVERRTNTEVKKEECERGGEREKGERDKDTERIVAVSLSFLKKKKRHGDVKKRENRETKKKWEKKKNARTSISRL
jgi:hypothetical protein